MATVRPDRNFLATAGIYLATAALTLAVAACVLQLWRADLSIPIASVKYGGDHLFYEMVVKNVVENGLHDTNSFLGAPGRADLYDFPLPHAMHFFFFKLLSGFSRNFAVVLNVYFLLTFPLTAIIALSVFRCFGVSYPSALLGSILFTFLPYHFLRGENHIPLAAYYLVPLTFLVSLWLCNGERFFRFEPATTDGSRAWVTPKGAVSLLSCVLVGLDGPYYAFFGAFFLAVAGLTARFRYGVARAIRTTSILVLVLVSTFALQLAPSFTYILHHGRNYEVVDRLPEESELLGMKITQLLLPVSGHRLRLLAAAKNYYNQEAPLINENDSASLGLIGSIGFLALIASLIFGKVEGRWPWLLDPLSVLNISGVLLATTGGFSSLFAFFVSPTIRCYNRLSIFLGFLAFFAVAVLLDALWQACARRAWTKPLFGFFVVSVLALGVLDQTTPGFVPNYRQIKAQYENDADFVSRVETSLPQNAMVFQLPYVAFPNGLGKYNLDAYDHLRAYLHSRNVRWSYGTIQGRGGDQWEKNVAAMPVTAMAENLAFAGFSGVYVDRFGYPDRAAQLESELADKLGTKPIVSANQELSFFSLSQLSAKLREEYSTQEWQMKEDAALHPVLADWRLGFYKSEGSPEQSSRWCCYFSRGELFIFNLSPSPQKMDFQMAVSTGDPEPSHLRIYSSSFSKTFDVSDESKSIVFSATVPPGQHVIRFVSDGKQARAPGDKRTLIFRVSNFHLSSSTNAASNISP